MTIQLADFNYDLPEALIAHYPLPNRPDSRLLCMKRTTGEIVHRHFSDLPDLLLPGDLLIFNDTRVIPARLLGHKASGGKVEVLIERLIDEKRALAHVRASKSPQAGSQLCLEDAIEVTVLGRRDDLYEIYFDTEKSALEALEAHGHMPLPPYIKRHDETLDRERYQTVYSRHQGSVAAPTAGLHFDEALLQTLTAKGIEFGFVTLHVGAGTFVPIRTDNIIDHKMHSEQVEVPASVCAQIAAAKAAGRRVIAVGTTSVRSLETAAKEGMLKPYQGETRLFIYPGYHFNCVDAVITNFHFPQSTLLMLVCAFAGQEATLAAYQTAVAERYRFFSYGDSMFCW